MFCIKCGNELAEAVRFCSNCGAAVSEREKPATIPAEAPASETEEPVEPVQQETVRAPEQVILEWKNQVKLLGNPAIWRGVLMAFGITCTLGAIFFAFISKSIEGLLAGAAAFALFMILFVIIAAIIDLFGGFHIRYALTDAGIRSMSGKGAKTAAGVAFWAGVLSGKPGLAGAGALAQSEQNVFIQFGDVSTIRLYPSRRYIQVSAGFLQKPIGLFCLPDNYVDAEKTLRRYCAYSKFLG